MRAPRQTTTKRNERAAPPPRTPRQLARGAAPPWTLKLLMVRLQQRFMVVRRRELLLFVKNLSMLLRAGSTILEALSVLQPQASTAFQPIIAQLREHVRQGFPLSEALDQHQRVFPPTLRGVVAVGERSGTLEANLAYVARQLHKQAELRRSVIGAMIYPFIIVLAISALGIIVSVSVLPQVVELFRSFNTELPITTRALIAFSDFLQAHGGALLGSLVIGIPVIVWTLRRPTFRPWTHRALLRLPIVRQLVVHLNLNAFCRTLGIFLETGTTIDHALASSAETTSNLVYRSALERLHTEVESGASLASTLEQYPDLFPATDVQMLRVGESSGSLAEAFTYCAEVHEEGVEALSKNLTAIVEPVLLLGIGFVVAVFALSIIGPLYSITSQVQS